MNELKEKLNMPDRLTRFFENDTDWGFVVKLSAVLEMAITELIADKLQDKKLVNIVRRSALNDIASGKMAYVKELGLLPLGYLNYVDEFIRLQYWMSQSASRLSMTVCDYHTGAPTDAKFVICLSKTDMDSCLSETDVQIKNNMLRLGVLYGAYKLIGYIEKEIKISIMDQF